MTTIRKHLLLTALILTAISSTAYPEPNQAPIPKIEFEISEKVISKTGSISLPQPKYSALVFLRKPNNLDLIRTGGRTRGRTRGRRGGRTGERQTQAEIQRLSSSVFAGVISQEQQEFNKLRPMVTRNLLHGGSTQPRDTNVFTVHGVSLEDTKAMVTAMIKWGDDKAYAGLESTKDTLVELRKKKSVLDAEIAKLLQAREEAYKKCELLKTTSFYKTVDQAQAALQEFNKTCQLLEIEIAGIKAKLEVYKQRPKSPVSATMRLTEEVALAAALARHHTAQAFRKAASDVIDCVNEQERMSGQWESKLQVRDGIEKRIKSVESTLANPPADMKPVEVVGKVIIYPRLSSEEQ